jgi:hypothetical protein
MDQERETAKDGARLFLDALTPESGHDPAAVKRLLDCQDMHEVWRWINRSAKHPPIAAFQLCVAALQAYGFSQGLGKMPSKERAKLRAGSHGVPFIGEILRSRKSGRQTDFLRAFLVLLKRHRFPLRERGAQTIIATTANVTLNRDEITPGRVSTVLKTIP